jgi:catechol 2,3-dioxygenase-like lactoylglutathione lyase family enzyme
MTSLKATTPVLPALSIQKTLAFYQAALNFSIIHQTSDYGIIGRDTVQLHFWHCHDRTICEASGCRIEIAGIDELYATLEPDLIHTNAGLDNKPWGTREFGMVDISGNLITFVEPLETS